MHDSYGSRLTSLRVLEILNVRARTWVTQNTHLYDGEHSHRAIARRLLIQNTRATLRTLALIDVTGLLSVQHELIPLLRLVGPHLHYLSVCTLPCEANVAVEPANDAMVHSEEWTAYGKDGLWHGCGPLRGFCSLAVDDYAAFVPDEELWEDEPLEEHLECVAGWAPHSNAASVESVAVGMRARPSARRSARRTMCARACGCAGWRCCRMPSRGCASRCSSRRASSRRSRVHRASGWSSPPYTRRRCSHRCDGRSQSRVGWSDEECTVSAPARPLCDRE